MIKQICSLIVCALCIMPQLFGASDKPFTVVLDPGHGGKDYGCVGAITNEKTIVLDVARRVGDLIADELPQVKTVFTRKDDRFIELSERAKIANKADADLFISIHVNSVDKRSKGREKVQGASVYTLGLHRTEANLAVAMRENAVIELEPDFSTTYQGFDPNSSESYIIFELTTRVSDKQASWCSGPRACLRCSSSWISFAIPRRSVTWRRNRGASSAPQAYSMPSVPITTSIAPERLTLRQKKAKPTRSAPSLPPRLMTSLRRAPMTPPTQMSRQTSLIMCRYSPRPHNWRPMTTASRAAMMYHSTLKTTPTSISPEATPRLQPQKRRFLS